MKIAMAIFTVLFVTGAFAQDYTTVIGSPNQTPTVDYQFIPPKPIWSVGSNKAYKISVETEYITISVQPDGRRALVINVPHSKQDIWLIDSNSEDSIRVAHFLDLLIKSKLLTHLSLGTIQLLRSSPAEVNTKTVLATVAGKMVSVASLYKTLTVNERGELRLTPELFRESLGMTLLSDKDITYCLSQPRILDQIYLALYTESLKKLESEGKK